MHLLRLKAENIFSLGKVTQDLGGRGLVLITGYSEDEQGANGAGKSSLANKAILFGLFGETAGGLKADAVLNRHGKRSGFAQIDFVGRDGAKYRVTRKRPADLILEREGQDVSAKTAKDTQEMINKALGTDFKTFVQTSFFGQGRNLSYPSLTPKEQKTVLEQILPMEEVDAWATYAEAQYKEVCKLATKAEGELSTLSTQNSTLKLERDHAVEQAKGFHLRQQNEILEIDRQLTNLDQVFANEKAKLEILEAQVNSVDLVELGQRQLELKEQSEHYRNNLMSESEQQYIAAVSSQHQWGNRKTYLKNEFKTISESASCPTCLRPYDDQEGVEKRKNTTLKLIDEADTNLELALQAVKYYGDIKVSHRNEYEEIQNSIQEINNTLTQHTVAEQEINTLKHRMNSARSQLEAQKASVQNQENPHDNTRARLDAQIIALESQILEANKKLGVINGEVEHLDYWRTVYAKELKLKLFEDACPFLDSRTAYHLERLKNSQIHIEFSTVKRLATGKAKEEFNVNVWSETGGTGFDSLSGGEQQMVSFAVGLALSDLASSVSSVAPSFLILDEPFSELDARNSEAIVEYLTSELGQGKDTIFLISNDDALKGLVPNRIHVVKSKGISSVN